MGAQRVAKYVFQPLPSPASVVSLIPRSHSLSLSLCLPSLSLTCLFLFSLACFLLFYFFVFSCFPLAWSLSPLSSLFFVDFLIWIGFRPSVDPRPILDLHEHDHPVTSVCSDPTARVACSASQDGASLFAFSFILFLFPARLTGFIFSLNGIFVYSFPASAPL